MCKCSVSKLFQQDQAVTSDSCTMPIIREHLIQDLHLLPDECITAQVKLEGEQDTIDTQSFLVEPNHEVFNAAV